MEDGGESVGGIGFDLDCSNGVGEAVGGETGAEGSEGVFGEVTTVATCVWGEEKGKRGEG